MHKTAFITKFGLFQHVRMGFGLCNAPATFQRIISLVFRGMIWKEVLAYIDDVIVLGTTFEEGISNLERVFQKFRNYNLKLKARKCNLFKNSVEFLGKKICPEGISITESKIQTVKNWQRPGSKKDVESYLGFMNYHREFIPKFAELSVPLYALTGKGSFVWGEEQEEAFIALKQKVLVATMLSYPTNTGLFIIDTDASDTAIGAELLQVQECREVPIAFASKVLTSQQRRYCTTRKELLAVIVFTRQFRHYLLGRKVVLRTDHHSLVWLTRFKRPEGQLARWLEEISQFDVEIQHRAGKKHINADGLSRMPDRLPICDCYHAGEDLASLPCGGCPYCTRAHKQWSRFEEEVDDVVPLAISDRVSSLVSKNTLVSTVQEISPAVVPSGTTEKDQPIREVSRAVVPSGTAEKDEEHEEPVGPECVMLPNYSLEELKQFQRSDPDLEPVIKWMESEYEPSTPELFMKSIITKHLWLCRPMLTLLEGVLYYRWEHSTHNSLKLVVPEPLKDIILQMCHDLKSVGHLGISKTIERLQKSFYWRNMTVDSSLYVRTCATCSKNKKASRTPRAGLGQYHAGAPIERVHIDMMGPFIESHNRNRYILMVIDQFTKWVECYPVPDQSAETISKTLVDNFITRFGTPVQIHSDQGRNFDGKLFKSLCELLEIAKTRTTPYRPCSNGQVERQNRTVLQCIRCYIGGNQRNWDKDLPLISMAHIHGYT